MVGQGARGARAEVLEVADLLGAGVAKALLGKDVLSDDLPFVTGSIGLLGTRPSYEMMMDCDTVLTVGSNFPYTQFMPEFDQARGIQIDRDGSFIGMRYPYELNIVADAAAALQALIPKLERKTDRTWRETIEKNVADWWDTMQRQAMTDSNLPERSEPAAIGMGAERAASPERNGGVGLRVLGQLVRPRSALPRRRARVALGHVGHDGTGVPYVIGAKFAHPDRPAIAIVGDGAMQMNGMAELLTIGRYWQEWSDPRLIVAVLHNND